MGTLPANGAGNCFARVARGSVCLCTRIRASENRPVSNYRTVGRIPGRTPALHPRLASGRNPEENTAMHLPPHVPRFASLLLLSIAASAAEAPTFPDLNKFSVVHQTLTKNSNASLVCNPAALPNAT